MCSSRHYHNVKKSLADVGSRYWQFIMSLFVGLVACELLLSPIPSVYQGYSSLIGYIGLAVEAILPLPQIIANAKSRSCKGFRFSVLASWLLGDSMKMFWFFTSKTTIPWAFKLCGIFQACCDSFLGVQYWMYGKGPTEIKEHELPSTATWAEPKADIFAGGRRRGTSVLQAQKTT